MKEHNVKQLLEESTAQLLINKPDDPLLFRECSGFRVQGSGFRLTAQLLIDKPDDPLLFREFFSLWRFSWFLDLVLNRVFVEVYLALLVSQLCYNNGC
jgi:hypothetical protein